jgi:hypothetical protein
LVVATNPPIPFDGVAVVAECCSAQASTKALGLVPGASVIAFRISKGTTGDNLRSAYKEQIPVPLKYRLDKASNRIRQLRHWHLFAPAPPPSSGHNKQTTNCPSLRLQQPLLFPSPTTNTTPAHHHVADITHAIPVWVAQGQAIIQEDPRSLAEPEPVLRHTSIHQTPIQQ